MTPTRRSLLSFAALPALSAGGLLSACAHPVARQPEDAPPAAPDLPNLAANAKPIPRAAYAARIAKAQALMREAGLSALLLESGSSLLYFTGVTWWRSERFTGAVIPADGDPVVICPYFEAPSIEGSRKIDAEIRTWHEDENPFALVAGVLSENGIATGRLGVEETVRFFIADGVARAAPGLTIVSGDPAVRGCRMIKTAEEIALMQTANDITLSAYRHIHPRIEAGMSGEDISAMMSAATRALGGAVEFSMCLINEASAYPHGAPNPGAVREGSTILMDCGCNVHGYQSDISRTFVFGDPSARQREVWATVKQGQELALATAQIGVAAGAVDDAVRRFYEAKGYGPGYLTPGLSHRLGHGIGIDGHEPVNLVRGETQPLEPGMCFSNEPGIYEFGAFGVRLEDCFHMTEGGPQLFSLLSGSIDDPFG